MELDFKVFSSCFVVIVTLSVKMGLFFPPKQSLHGRFIDMPSGQVA